MAYKDLGMVSTVLTRYLSENRPSRIGIGHVRYSTNGGNKLENAQPIVVKCNKGDIALAHNGNISNTDILKDKLFQEGSIFQSTSDTELILHLLSRSRETDFFTALCKTLGSLEGAFSLVMIWGETLIGIRTRRASGLFTWAPRTARPSSPRKPAPWRSFKSKNTGPWNPAKWSW